MVGIFFRQSFYWFAAFFIIFSSGESLAQSVGNYSVTRTTGITYSSIIATGNSFSGWRYTGGFSEDDNRSLATDIGFDYWYNGVRYTQFSVSTNGFLDFSSSTADGGPVAVGYGYDNDYFTDSNDGTYLALAPFYDDMTTSGGVDPLGSSIKYLLSGTAPNRVLTVEWDGMAVYQNTTPDINFQVKIHETTGVIEYVYGTMDDGTKTFSYTVGINGPSISNNPRANELLTQRFANTNNFSRRVQNNLSDMPDANSKLIFTPPLPSNPTGSLSFTSITNIGMTLNWDNWANNEQGFVLYYSTDNTSYYFHSQTVADATSSAVSGLLPSTTYYWRVYAVTEGTLSTALQGNATTLAPGNVTSIANGNWNQTTTWDCTCVPSASDNVIVDHQVDIVSGNAIANKLTINSDPVVNNRVRLNGATPRVLTINSDLTIVSGARMIVANGSNVTHTINISGDIINNGIININKDPDSYVAVNFLKKNGNQTISGSGTNNTYYTLNIDKGVKTNILEITSTKFGCNADALTFTSGGTFKFSSSGTDNFTLFNTTRSIPSNGKIWMNSTGSTMNFAASVNLYGELVVDNGTVNVGNGANENLISFGGSITINAGNLNIAGRLDRNNTESTTSYLQTGGTLTVPTSSSTSTSQSPFGIDVTGSSFLMTGGSIILQREGGSGAQNLGINTSGISSHTVTGGTLQIGDGSTPVTQSIQIDLGSPIGGLLLNSANATALLAENIDILSDVTLTSGVLNDNNFNITVGGNWLAISGSFIPSTASNVQFNGANQSITTAGSAFNHLTLAGSGNKTFQDNLDVNGNFLSSVGFVAANSGFTASIGGDWTNNGTFTRNNETVILDGTGAQSIGGSSTNNFTNIIINKSGGSVSFDSNLNLYNTLDIQSATTLDVDGSGSEVFTLISNATEDARIASLASGASISGNLAFEKYFDAGLNYWRHISSAVVGAQVSELQTGIPISGFFTGNNNGQGNVPAGAHPSLYYYDNATGPAPPTGTLDDRWLNYPVTTNTELVTTSGSEAKGYAIWLWDSGPSTYSLKGQVNQGTVDLNPSGNNEGWNLLGNPFPSDIDWNSSTGWNKTAIQGNAIFIWNGSSYLTWNGTTGNLGNGRIAKGQGFWVQAATASIGLTATEAVKTATSTTTYRVFQEDNPPVIDFSVSASGYNDHAFIQFVDTAKFEYDIADAPKLANSIFNLATMSSDSVNLSINVLSGGECSFDVPVDLSNTWDDAYSISWNVSNELLEIYNLSLKDLFTSEIYDISSGATGFDFDINADPLTKQINRFILHFETKSINTDVVIVGNQSCESSNTGSINIIDSQLGVEYEIWVSDNILTAILGTGNDVTYLVDSTYLTWGANEFTIKGKRPTCEDQQFESVINLEMKGMPIIKYDADMNLLLNDIGNAGYWYEGDELLSSAPSNSFAPDNISGGNYTIEVRNNNCSFISDAFLVTDVILEETSIQITLSPNPANNYIEIHSNGEGLNNSTIQIVDINGRLHYTGEMNQAMTNIDISEYNKGVYIVIISSTQESQKLRFIKL